LKVKNSKLTVLSGKSSDIIVEVNSKNLSEGDYKKTITIQTNDPDRSIQLLILNWTIKK